MYSEPLSEVLPLDLKWKLIHHGLEHWQQIGLADALYTGLNLPLAGRIHAGDVIDPLGAIQIALVHADNAHPARSSIGPWYLAYANGVTHRAGRG